MTNHPHDPDAKRLLHNMLRDHVAPGLRRLGFVGSGNHFSLRNTNGDHALLGFQRWSYNRAGLARFTVNVAFYGLAEWQEEHLTKAWLPSVPTPNEYYDHGCSERIGFLTAHPHDHWWAVRQDEDEARAVAQDVLAVVEGEALPELLTRLHQEEPPRPRPIEDDPPFECPWPYCLDTLDPDDLL